MTHTVAPLPVSSKRLEECEFSARFWAREIGPFADEMRRRADRYAIAAVVLSTLTGLGVWPILATSTAWPARLAVSIVALAAAIVTAIPRIKGYAECAQAAAPLSQQYGQVLGQLIDVLKTLHQGHLKDASIAAAAVDAFEKVRAVKQGLRPYPTVLQNEINRLREQLAQPKSTALGV